MEHKFESILWFLVACCCFAVVFHFLVRFFDCMFANQLFTTRSYYSYRVSRVWSHWFDVVLYYAQIQSRIIIELLHGPDWLTLLLKDATRTQQQAYPSAMDEILAHEKFFMQWKDHKVIGTNFNRRQQREEHNNYNYYAAIRTSKTARKKNDFPSTNFYIRPRNNSSINNNKQ